MRVSLLKFTGRFLMFFLLAGFSHVFAESDFQNIKIQEIGSKTRLALSLGKAPLYKTNQLTNPFRIVITFTDKITCKAMEPLSYTTGIITNIRFLTLKNKASEETGLYFLDSVIVELREDARFEAFAQENELMLDIFKKTEEAQEKAAIETSPKEKSQPADNSVAISKSLESAKKNFESGYYLLAKSDCQNVISLDSSNKEAEDLLKKIDDKIALEKEQANKLADELAKNQAVSTDKEKEDAKVLAGALENQMMEKGKKEEDYNNFIKDGQGLYKNKRYEEAVEMWERALEIRPQDAEATTLIAKANAKIKERVSAETQAPQVQSQEQKDEIEKLIAQGEDEFHNMQYVNSISTFERVLQLDSNNLKAMRYLAQAKKNQRSYVEEGGSPEDVVMKPKVEEENLGVISLNDAINLGLVNHIPTKIAQEEIFLAKYKVSESKRQLFPQAKLKYKNTAGTSGDPSKNEDFKGNEYSIEFQQNIWTGGKYRSLYNQSRVNLAVARKNYEKSKAEFVFEVTQAYYNFVFAKEKLKNKLELKRIIEELLVIAEKQFNAKALTLSEILEARSQLEEVNFQVKQIQNDYDLALLAIQQLLSQTLNVKIDVADIPEPFIFNLDENKLTEVAYKNRRDYQVNKLLVLFNKYAVEIAKKKEKFNVELSGSYGKKDEYYVSEQVDLQNEYYIGVKVSKSFGPHTLEANVIDQDKVPQVGATTSSNFNSEEVALKLWDQKTKTTVTEANIAYHKALSDLENSKRSLIHDIRSSIYSVYEAEAKIKNDKSLAALASEELRSTRAKQKADQASIVQVMRAESKTWNEKTDLLSDQADYYINIAKLNKNVGIQNYMDPSTGVISSDKEDAAPGVRLVVEEKYKDKKWYNIMPFSGGIKSYYPDEVVTDVLKEKQEKSAMESTKGFLGISKWFKKDSELEEYKQYDEKYDFSTPKNNTGKKWWPFGKKKLNDDFSGYYSSSKEYDQAFNVTKKVEEVKEETAADKILKTEAVNKPEEEKDYFAPFLQDKERKVFAEYHVEDSKLETVLAIRTNGRVEYTTTVLKNPARLIITIKEAVISALPDYESIKSGAVVSLKAIHTKVVLPSQYRDWKKLLSMVIEMDADREYSIESDDSMFKVIIKK